MSSVTHGRMKRKCSIARTSRFASIFSLLVIRRVANRERIQTALSFILFDRPKVKSDVRSMLRENLPRERGYHEFRMFAVPVRARYRSDEMTKGWKRVARSCSFSPPAEKHNARHTICTRPIANLSLVTRTHSTGDLVISRMVRFKREIKSRRIPTDCTTFHKDPFLKNFIPRSALPSVPSFRMDDSRSGRSAIYPNSSVFYSCVSVKE